MEDFARSEAGQHGILAKQFMEGALVLSDAPPERARLLLRPTLALAGHGLELLLKACLLLNGMTPPRSGKREHNVRALWSDGGAAPIRASVAANAVEALRDARADSRYSAVPSDGEAWPMIEQYIELLADLHGAAGYPLRYPSDPNLIAPRAPFLVATLWRTSDDFLKRPFEFSLSVA